jgi:WD40 repeat protein
VVAVTTTVLDGRPVAVTGSEDSTVRVWDLHAQRSHDATVAVPGQVSSLDAFRSNKNITAVITCGGNLGVIAMTDHASHGGELPQ